MTGTTHRLGGIIAGIGTMELLGIHDLKTQGIIIGASIVGSLIPDIDNPQSTISYKIPVMRSIVGILQGAIRLTTNLLPRKQKQYVRSCIGHRGVTHSILFALLIPGLILMLGRIIGVQWNLVALGIFIGLMSHIILDFFAGGVPFFIPFYAKRVAIMHIKTGGIAEWLVRIGFILLIGIICLWKGDFIL